MLSPAQLKIIQGILEDVALRLNINLSMPLVEAIKFMDDAEHFIRKNAHWKRKYVLALDLASTGSARLTWETVAAKINAGLNIIKIDKQFRLIGAVDGGDLKVTDAFKRSKANSSLELHVNEDAFVYYAINGEPDEFSIAEPGQGPSSRALRRRRFEDFDQLLDDHFKQHVDREKGFDYWYKRPKRILLAGHSGTEWIFQRNLIWWLRQCVQNYTYICAEPNGPGEDKTDINVVTDIGAYLVEIKWLGENEKGTKNEQSQIDKGLAQVKLYLEREENYLRGYLVIYDARAAEKHKKESGWDPQHAHERCEHPKIFFLDSDMPSEAAPKKVAIAKKK